MAVLKRTEMHNVSLISNGDNARVQRAKLQATWLEHKMQTYNKYLDMWTVMKIDTNFTVNTK